MDRIGHESDRCACHQQRQRDPGSARLKTTCTPRVRRHCHGASPLLGPSTNQSVCETGFTIVLPIEGRVGKGFASSRTIGKDCMTVLARTASGCLGVGALALLFAFPPLHAQSPAPRSTVVAPAPPAILADNAEMRAFVDALMARMTLKEKIGQLTLLSSGWESTGPTLRDSYKRDIAA